MSSLKMTFSLTSLILIFGLVFVAMPVMAHDNATDANDTPRPHDHPLTETLAADEDVGGTGTVVTPHGVHPTVMSIVAKSDDTLRVADGQDVILLNTDGDAILELVTANENLAGTFKVIVTFSGTLATDEALIDSEVSITARRPDGTPLTTGFTDTVAAVTDKPNQFEVTITVPEDAWSTDDANNDSNVGDFGLLLPIEVFITIDAGAVQTGTTIDGAGNTLNPAASDAYSSDATTKFTVVESIAPPPEDLPDATVTVAPDTYHNGGRFLVTFSFADDDAPTMFTEDDIDPGGNARVLPDSVKEVDMPPMGMKQWTAVIEVLLPNDTSDVMVTVQGDNVEAAAATDGSVTVEHSIPVPNHDPYFANTTVQNLPAGLCVGDTLPPNVILPLATDNDRDTLIYTLTKISGTDSVTVPVAPPVPASGFYWDSADRQDRVLKGTATLADGGTYTWTVSDSQATAEVTFTIEVKAPVKPVKPTALVSEKVDADSKQPVDRDRVTLTWAAPDDLSAYPDCIPAISSYLVTRQKFDILTGIFEPDPDGTDGTVTHNVSDQVPNSATSYTTPELAAGIYQFTIQAQNAVGPSDASDPAEWTLTGGDRIVVADVPEPPEDLDATIDNPDGSVTLDWLKVPDEDDGGAPIYDDLVDMSHADYADLIKERNNFYGADVMGDFGGYVVYQTNEQTAEVTRYPEEGTISTDDFDYAHPAYQVTGLNSGEYVFRIVAKNIAGESPDSHTATKRVLVVRPGTGPGTANTAPVFADDAEIASIVATEGTPISGRFLPEATDADGDALTYLIVETLPTGLEFNATNRALTGTPTEATEETAFTYTVFDADGGSDTISFFITVNAAVSGPPPTSTVTTSLPAGGHIVYVRDMANPPHFGTSNPMIAGWADMPNLYELFTQGGGGSLQLTVTGADGNNIAARQVVFSEVMWAVDNGQVGQDAYDANQWIELHNRTATAIPISDISFATKDGRPALAQGTDLISNVVGGGSAWIRTKGQNGNSTAGSLEEFISMYRKRYHNDSAGWNGGEWLASTEVYHPNHKGTPGKPEPQGVKTFPATSVPLTTIFNEIANYPSGNSDHEWIELRIKSGDPNFANWVVDMVTGAADRDITTNPTQARLFKMPELNKNRFNKDWDKASDSFSTDNRSQRILLITKTDPARDDNHPLRGGYNVEKSFADQDNEGLDENIRYYVADDWNTDLPDNGEFVLILRHNQDRTNHERVEDLAGYHPNLKVETATFFTNLWPLIGYPAPNRSNNKIAAGEVDRRDKPDIAGTLTKDGNKIDQVAFRSDNNDWTGIGYKRNADAGDQNGGTPGYANNALAAANAAASGDPVIISEIMYSTGDRGNITQWIELRNMSQTVGVNLDGWRVTIVNHDQDSADTADTYPGDLVKSYGINGKIPPGQTFLIVAHSGTDETNLPSERIEQILNRRGDVFLSQYGFEITLETALDGSTRKLADKVGNLAAGADGNVRGNPQSYEDPAWPLPSGMNDDGDRVSIVRVAERGDFINGQLGGAWKSFEMSVHANATESTYYGNRNDLSSPGYTVDGVLPVSLSKFRPERMKDTGAVVVRWVTESETNNAGFNILRGEAIDGEFTKLNTKLIAGKGTTSERTTYEYADTSAKPNVVYYYQIQDVSLDGEVQTLRTTHLRGNVSAAGKLTTTWGELKALQ